MIILKKKTPVNPTVGFEKINQTAMRNKQSSSSSSSLPLYPQTSSTSFDCIICTESSIPYNKKFINNNKEEKNSNYCLHPFCIDCIAKHIQVKDEEENTAEIRCPDIECGTLLDPHMCQSIVSPCVFERWYDLLLDHMLLTKMKGKTLYCPYRNCSTQLLLNDDKKQKWCPEAIRTRTKCPVCERNFCYQCKTPWHAGYTCEEAPHIRDSNDFLFDQLIEQKNWVRCPTCRNYVERSEGCHHMICRCGARFCYDCGRLKCIDCPSNRSLSVISLIIGACLLLLFIDITRGIIGWSVRFCLDKWLL